jgi:hypothetical protein
MDNQIIGYGGEVIEPMALQSQPHQGVQAINHGLAAAEAAAQAMVQARFQMALYRPRNVLQARAKILDACRRPGFAESAMYRKPVGKKDGVQQYVEGPSIRFAEEAIRCLGNIDIRIQIVHEDEEKRILCVTVMDLENNVSWPTEIPISKRVERSYVKEGQTVHSKRLNSYNKPVYTVDGTEDEIVTKQQAAVSKTLRTAALRVVPGDILEEAMVMIRETLSKKDAHDPKAATKRVLDAFQSQGISPAELEKFLGHSLEIITPTEIQDLRGTYQSIKDGDSTWADVLASAEEGREEKKKLKDTKEPEQPKDKDTKTNPIDAAKDKARDAAKNMSSDAGSLPLDQ